MIGIGAGAATDGQVLVFHDLLGIRDGLGARFVKRYANLQQEMNAGVTAYAEDVRTRRYPGREHTYSIDPAELAELRRSCAERPRRRPRAPAVSLGERELLQPPAGGPPPRNGRPVRARDVMDREFLDVRGSSERAAPSSCAAAEGALPRSCRTRRASQTMRPIRRRSPAA